MRQKSHGKLPDGTHVKWRRRYYQRLSVYLSGHKVFTFACLLSARCRRLTSCYCAFGSSRFLCLPIQTCSCLDEQRANSYTPKDGLLVRTEVLTPRLRMRWGDFTKRFAEHLCSVGKRSSLYSDDPDGSFDFAIRKCEWRNSSRYNLRRH
jgi:hypothetical protein